MMDDVIRLYFLNLNRNASDRVTLIMNSGIVIFYFMIAKDL